MLPNMVTSEVFGIAARKMTDVLLTKRLPPRKSNGARNGTLIPARSDERREAGVRNIHYHAPPTWFGRILKMGVRVFHGTAFRKVKEVKLIKGRE